MITIEVNRKDELSFYTAKDFESWLYMKIGLEEFRLKHGKFYTIKDNKEFKTLVIFDSNMMDNRRYYSDKVDFELLIDVLTVVNIPCVSAEKLHLYKQNKHIT